MKVYRNLKDTVCLQDDQKSKNHIFGFSWVTFDAESYDVIMQNPFWEIWGNFPLKRNESIWDYTLPFKFRLNGPLLEIFLFKF